jgi:transposase
MPIRFRGLGRVRAAVERGHAWLNQFDRVRRPLDRRARRLLGWVQLAACIVFIRAEANGFFR